MATATPIMTALEIAEDAILVQLRLVASGVVAAFPTLPADTVRRLALYAAAPADADAIPYALVAQHQDAGGAQAPHVNSAGWAGLIVVKALSASDAQARAAHALAAARMASLVSPAGYRLAAVWDRPVAIPPSDGIYQRAGQWRVSIKRTA